MGGAWAWGGELHLVFYIYYHYSANYCSISPVQLFDCLTPTLLKQRCEVAQLEATAEGRQHLAHFDDYQTKSPISQGTPALAEAKHCMTRHETAARRAVHFTWKCFEIVVASDSGRSD